MAAFSINRGEASVIGFSITDTDNGLLGKRVTWSVSVVNGKRVVKKQSALPLATSSEVEILTSLAGLITGKIHVLAGDFVNWPSGLYHASVWVDDGAGGDVCMTQGGVDTMTLNPTSPRKP